MESVAETISFDDMVGALAHVQRRRLLIELLEHDQQTDSPVVIDDAASASETVNRTVLMRHTHLPKLADHGLIEWDDKTLEVMEGPNFEEIRPLLELLDAHDQELPADWT